jgi:uncharacterized Rmd1/YagE family protein
MIREILVYTGLITWIILIIIAVSVVIEMTTTEDGD